MRNTFPATVCVRVRARLGRAPLARKQSPAIAAAAPLFGCRRPTRGPNGTVICTGASATVPCNPANPANACRS